uniref:MCE family protein n=1 Tax=Mycobacterium avium TaxID=1764 RepID=UPI0015C47478
YTCLFQGAQWYVDHGGRDALGGNGYSVILDAALLFGDDPYRYPKHLPKVNATGGPGGRPSCGSLPDPSANFPVRALVTDTGWGAAPNEIRTNVAPGNPWWANWFPTTKNPPEAPRYFWRGGQPPP